MQAMAKTVFITGASSGIGLATSKLFSRNGWNVVATMRAPEKDTELKTLDNILLTHLDVQDLSSIESAVKQGIDRFGKFDVVVNNAGYGLLGVFEAIPREKMQEQFDVNVFGVYILSGLPCRLSFTDTQALWM
jgi:NAD(P)-dependent dehydrogenase (short-subunit alcohol dehydrogenase family)